ncbi:MAG: sigma-E factor negative regulatory protein [Woeseiaceae bacterium]|nr:sigma-E factor negative regulatory protein [Woeseiaceae bacterium]
MNEALKMQISAFIDGELPENEAELLLRRLNQDAAMRQQVAKYLAIGRYMRRDPELPGMPELRSRIASALGEELAPVAQVEVRQASRFLRPALGVALAASVAVVALVGLRQSILPDAAGPGTQAAVELTGSAPSITQAAAEDVLSDELRHMYLRHSASSADFGSNGMITRLVTLELQGGERVRIDPQNSAAATAAIDAMVPSEDDDADVDEAGKRGTDDVKRVD